LSPSLLGLRDERGRGNERTESRTATGTGLRRRTQRLRARALGNLDITPIRRQRATNGVRRSGVSSAIAAVLLIVGILVGVAGFYVAMPSQTKTATQTETTTARLTTTMATMVPTTITQSTTLTETQTQTVIQPTTQTTTDTSASSSSGSLPSPATITPSSTTVDSGQQVSISVGWRGGSAPYTITLYGSSSGGCNSSSTILSAKSGQSQPQFVFIVSPVSTMRYCGVVYSSNGSSAVSSSVVVTVNP
jgi:hypothetical protein